MTPQSGKFAACASWSGALTLAPGARVMAVGVPVVRLAGAPSCWPWVPVTRETPGNPSITHAAEPLLVTVTWRPMCPAEFPPGAGSTTALAVLTLHRLPAEVRDPVDVTEEVPEPVDVVEAAGVDVLGAGVGVGGELLHAPRAVASPAAASTAHTERTERSPCVLTPPR